MFLGYLLGLVLVLSFVGLTWSNLSQLQEMVSSGEVVTNLFDNTLEIRRFEKNYFLYRTSEDFRELGSYVNDTQELLSRPELLVFTDEGTVSVMSDDLEQYRALLQQDAVGAPEAQAPELEAQIREKGKSIVDAAASISADRDRVKADALGSAKRNFIIGIVALLVAGLAGGVFFYRKAVQPLSVLEKHMRRIAAGGFSLINYQFHDSELTQLKTVFNRMLIELEERQEHLVQSEKLASMGTLVFGVAHELNNPISNISTSSQILREELDGGNIDHLRELVEQIESESDRARDIVGSILEFSRSREREVFELKKAIDETIRFIRAEVPAKVEIVTNIPEGLTLTGDRQKVQQLVLNLVKNAADAMPAEGKITVQAGWTEEGGGRVELVVRDNGAGMEPEVLEHVFDPFFTSKKNKDGYGLGLFIVHNIVEEHAGTIDVDSYPGKGTVFTVRLPMNEKELRDEE